MRVQPGRHILLGHISRQTPAVDKGAHQRTFAEIRVLARTAQVVKDQIIPLRNGHARINAAAIRHAAAIAPVGARNERFSLGHALLTDGVMAHGKLAIHTIEGIGVAIAIVEDGR